MPRSSFTTVGVRFTLVIPTLICGKTKVNLTPTVVKDERGIPHTEPNAPVYIYDTSGPYSDPDVYKRQQQHGDGQVKLTIVHEQKEKENGRNAKY